MLTLTIHLFAIFAVQCDEQNIAQKMRDAKIVPMLLRHPPERVCKVQYGQYGEINPGDHWLCNVTDFRPNITWPAEPDTEYLLYFADVYEYDPEAHLYQYTRRPITIPPKKIYTDPLWTVINIPGGDVSLGKEILCYTTPGPPIDDNVLEYNVYLVYKQPKKNMTIKLVEYEQSGTYIPDVYNLTKLEDEYNLGKPIFGNYWVLTVTGMWDELRKTTES